MKNKILIIIFVIAILTIGSILIINTRSNNASKKENTIEITQYKIGSPIKIKNIKLTSQEDILVFNNYISDIKPLSSDEMVDLEIAKEIEIKYKNYTIIIQLEETNYCYYKNNQENFSSLSKMPNGLYDWILEKIN